MPLKLFEGSDSEDDDVSKIQIDPEYARRYEHNKKREDLHRLQELKKKGLVQCSESESSSSSDEEDDDFVNSSKKDREFFEALIKVKKQDPVIKNKDVRLFESDEEEEEEEEPAEEDTKDVKNKKAMYLKDVVAKQLIEDGPELEDEELEGKLEEAKKKSYAEELEDIRREFLEAAADEDEGGELLKMKEKNEEDEEKGGEFVRKLDEYFGGDGEVDESNKFLKEFFRSRMWVDKEVEGREIEEDELERVLEDEREIERQEEYEYRFQENTGDRVMGHARKVEGSVRKKVNSRKEQRKSKEERMDAARIEREEELKHLKNLKKEDMDEKVRRILRTAGIREDEVVPLSRKELEEEFDPEEYDRMMKAAFSEKYYEEEDADPEFGSNGDEDEDEGEIGKPDFEEEDRLLGLPKGWDECGPGGGFLAARERSLKTKVLNSGENDYEEEEEAEEGKGKRKRKKSALLEKAKEAMMEEYYKLDYEDTIGDLRTRFKYAKTKPNRYGLSAEELLVMDEKELNQYISLKKLAPYKEKEWKLSNKKRFQLKMRTKELLRGGNLEDQNGHKKKRLKNNAEESASSVGDVEDGKLQFQGLNGDMSSLSRQARRRRRQAEVKLSHSRLMAYGKIPSKSKSKAKH
ncbi:hypothetical protein CJ030_MR8G000577 [Morella rubra]|uniref:Kri1-like C-terminal domain-containing protein n=1 Tax=Morella rubra TaxID=262757 RepID=A0A6A1UT52_9ROSI|nr:hypothetical protein CJ030_MR8G000570 [Morella rubra]KAB1203428.1 hypothetical protein CJ030_MR8G000577 [Morella rubra]